MNHSANEGWCYGGHCFNVVMSVGWPQMQNGRLYLPFTFGDGEFEQQ